MNLHEIGKEKLIAIPTKTLFGWFLVEKIKQVWYCHYAWKIIKENESIKINWIVYGKNGICLTEWEKAVAYASHRMTRNKWETYVRSLKMLENGMKNGKLNSIYQCW